MIEAIDEVVQAALQQIEQEHAVRIVFACESGSRAWGFPSADSDYDVRFIYVQQPDWYLSIDVEQRRDVIEVPINDQLDINGWDVRKALHLFRRSNPPLLEWLGSPIIYLERYSVAQQLRELAPQCYSPRACMYHYLHMAQGNFRDYLRAEQVRVKKYFYVLRPLLGVLWLENNLGVVPTEFTRLVEATITDSNLKQCIYDLIKQKQSGAELDSGPRIPLISEFIERELTRFESLDELAVQRCSYAVLNQLFRATLHEVWGN